MCFKYFLYGKKICQAFDGWCICTYVFGIVKYCHSIVFDAISIYSYICFCYASVANTLRRLAEEWGIFCFTILYRYYIC